MFSSITELRWLPHIKQRPCCHVPRVTIYFCLVSGAFSDIKERNEFCSLSSPPSYADACSRMGVSLSPPPFAHTFEQLEPGETKK